jgi:hypothetical protein
MAEFLEYKNTNNTVKSHVKEKYKIELEKLMKTRGSDWLPLKHNEKKNRFSFPRQVCFNS